MPKEKLTASALSSLIAARLDNHSGCTVAVNPDSSLGWAVVVYARVFDAGDLQMRAEQVAQDLRNRYDLKT